MKVTERVNTMTSDVASHLLLWSLFWSSGVLWVSVEVYKTPRYPPFFLLHHTQHFKCTKAYRPRSYGLRFLLLQKLAWNEAMSSFCAVSKQTSYLNSTFASLPALFFITSYSAFRCTKTTPATVDVLRFLLLQNNTWNPDMALFLHRLKQTN